MYWEAPSLEAVGTTYNWIYDAMLIAGNNYNITCTDSYGDGWHGAELMIDDLTLIDNNTGSFANKKFSIFIDETGYV